MSKKDDAADDVGFPKVLPFTGPTLNGDPIDFSKKSEIMELATIHWQSMLESSPNQIEPSDETDK